jgi:hypothetical protein
MKWSRTHTLVAGLALILATNAVALVGVAYNRSDEPESTLTLTQRELHLPYGWGFGQENSGISLAVQTRVLADQDDTRHVMGGRYAGFGNAPGWLDKAKLAALGFDVAEPEDSQRARMHYDKLLPKEALLVLELDGPAYRTALEDAQKHMQKEEALLKANAGKKEFEVRAKNAKQELYQEERIYSRLFIIDAGLDAVNLRAKYPDRKRYAIMRGQIQPYLVENNRKTRLVGYITGLSVSRINVPALYREIFESMQESAQTNESGVAASPFEVSVAYGKRLEPWVTEAKKAK